MTSESGNILFIKYVFQLKREQKKEFDVRIDKKSLNILLPERENIPKWVDLNFFKCVNCSLDEMTNPHCPAARSMIDVIEFFKDFVSFTEADIVVETENRSLYKHTSLQVGISSLIGLCMATSGCPVLGKLKPMAWFHLPFASPEETVFRAMSTYLLAQYFRKLHGKIPDWDLENLEGFYKEIHTVNKGFAVRLKNIHIHDAGINALNILDTFANFVLLEIHEHVLKEFETAMSKFIEY
jgi:hypothetical protein